MARRRAIGRSLSRSAEMFQERAKQLMQAQIQEQSQKRMFEHQNQLLAQREQLQAERATELEGLRSKNNRAQFEFEHPEASMGTGSRLAAPIAAGLDKVTDPAALPTNRGMATQMGGTNQIPNPMTGALMGEAPKRPEVMDLISQRDAKREAIMAELARKRQETEDAKSRILPGGNAGFIGAGGQEISTERTTEDEGSRQAGVLTATGPVQTRTAANTAAATTGARINTEFANKDKLGAIAQAQDTSQGGAAGAAAGGRTESARVLLDRFKELSSKINVADGPEQIYIGGTRMAKAMINMDNEMSEFQAIGGPLAMIFTVITQGSRPTDTDVAIVNKLFPNGRTNKTVAQNLIALAESQLRGSGAEGMSLDQLLQLADQGKLQRKMTREQMFKMLQDAVAGKTQDPASARKLYGRGGGF